MRDLHVRFWNWVFEWIHELTCDCDAFNGLDDD